MRPPLSPLWMPPFAFEPEENHSIPPAGYRPTWIEVDLAALHHNLEVLRRHIREDCAIMAVVKDNAYGHGILPVARHLAPRVEMLGVAILEEAAVLRRAGIACPIFILGGLWPGQESQALQLHVTPAVFSIAALRRWEEAARAVGVRAAFHLKVDTGMNRWGVTQAQLAAFLDEIETCAQARCEGIMTHLACADSPETSFTNDQLERFRQCVVAVRQRGLALRWIHAANSAGILDHPDSHFNMVRPGIALYGYDSQQTKPDRGLQPVLALKSRVSLLKDIPAGSTVGYGAIFVASKTLRLATVPIGYGDGYSRAWSDKGRVFIGRRTCPVVGRVSMDSITVDVTEVEEVTVGTEVVLLGRFGSHIFSASAWGEQLGTIPYEILTSLGPRLGRAYFRDQESGIRGRESEV